MRSLNTFLLYYIGNSNYLIINCVPKLVWVFSQAIRLQRINKVFYLSIRKIYFVSVGYVCNVT